MRLQLIHEQPTYMQINYDHTINDAKQHSTQNPTLYHMIKMPLLTQSNTPLTHHAEKIDHQRELQFIATGSKHNYHTCKYCTFVKCHVTCAHPHITGDGARCVASALATKGFMVDGSPNPSSILHQHYIDNRYAYIHVHKSKMRVSLELLGFHTPSCCQEYVTLQSLYKVICILCL